ncbi:hypothetical protein [Streptomyces sp. NPDC056323]|uniref:hypothetical protein n=1 Tax=Streptomyces sp. NPDC056323 TaxID=3345784 RepID=UPI0035E33418
MKLDSRLRVRRGKRITDFWQLEFHYHRAGFSFDELFTADEALLHWWTERLDPVEDAYSAGLRGG